MSKWQFIESELIADSIHAAFQRGNIYKASVNDSERAKLRDRLGELLSGFREEYKEGVVAEDHIGNIAKISRALTHEFRPILCNDKFRVGTSQKALNLYLKYMWCLDKVTIPPHCPFDGIIIKMLDLLPEYKAIQWTKMDSLDEYRALVAAAESRMREKSHPTLAEWELAVYERKSAGRARSE